MHGYVRNALWLLLRFARQAPPAGGPDLYNRGWHDGWRDGVEAAAKALGVDPQEFERLNALNAFTEQGIPVEEYDRWAERRAAEANEEEANRFG